jgi:hypothetical protein
MKIHFLQNWFKLMIGTSALIVSVAFLIRSISPAYATNTLPVNVANYNGVVEGTNLFFIDNGYIFKVKLGQLDRAFKNGFLGGSNPDNWGKTMVQGGMMSVPLNDGLPVWWTYKKIGG